MMTDYRLQPNTRRCEVSGRELEPGEKYFSVLFDEEGKFLRKDYGADVWEGPPEGAFSFWMGTIPTEQSKKKPVIDNELLMDCFNRLEGQTEPSRLRFRFVVALLLVRRRRLVLESIEEEDGKEILALRDMRKGGNHRIENPGLSDDEIAQVQDEVFELLGWE